MRIFEFNKENIPKVAELMANIKPDWWDYQGALGQLSDIRNTAYNVGWFMGEDERHPKGWLLCTDYECYSCLSIECLGYDEHGRFVMENEIRPLLETAERYAHRKGYRILRYMIGSKGMSCDNHPLRNYWEELRDLKSFGREHFDFFIEYGFKPAGFMPNCLGENYHCIIMIKEIMDYTVTSLNKEKENREFFLTYLKECDWKSGNILAELIDKGDFFNEDDEIFFLMDGKSIVSYLILAHQDCIPDETLGPWIGFVYTDKKYRGNRCSEKLIRYALNIAESRGYKKIYLATGHVGLYEKYGFVYSESRKDIYNEDCRIYYYDLSDSDQRRII